MAPSDQPVFWRDARMPHVELRKVEDGRKVCYAPHSHTHWSLGAITGGRSTFVYRDQRYEVDAGTLVLMNPDWVHACNPIDDEPWAYLMLYVDTPWLVRLRHDLGLLQEARWQDIPTPVIRDSHWYRRYCQLAECLLDDNAALLDKQTRVVEFLSGLMRELAGEVPPEPVKAPARLLELAGYLDAHAAEDVSLDALCVRSGYSPGHLVRAFRQHFGLPPHAYLVNRRIQLGQRQLKQGRPIAEAALNAGFADQPHFQRTFKRLVAATPRQYRQPTAGPSVEPKGDPS